jgi:ankyrin repeat protein
MRVASEGEKEGFGDQGASLSFLVTAKGTPMEKPENDDSDPAETQQLDEFYEKEANLLLDKGADINAKDKYGETALLMAVKYDHVGMIHLLKKRGAETTLLIASMLGDTEEVRRLIDAGADVKATTPDGLCPLVGAAARAQVEVAKILLEKGADIHPKKGDSLDAFSVAMSAGDVGMIKLMMDKGADVKGKSDGSWTPLMSAASDCRADLAALFLEKGADVNAVDRDGRTPLMCALVSWTIHRSPTEVVKLLIEKGAGVNMRDKDGASALT